VVDREKGAALRFMVERYLPGITEHELLDAVARTAGAIQALAAEGVGVRHLQCTFVPSEESVFCHFEGPSAESVREANRRAKFPFDRVLDIVPLLEPQRKSALGSAQR
jgi:hypothetical protein